MENVSDEGAFYKREVNTLVYFIKLNRVTVKRRIQSWAGFNLSTMVCVFETLIAEKRRFSEGRS